MQPASPTTLGKEMAIFAVRLSEERRYLAETKIKGKFAGAVGNYNAHVSAYPNIDWPHVADEFVTSLGLTFNPYVTQVYTIWFYYLHYIFIVSLSDCSNCFCRLSLMTTWLDYLIQSASSTTS